jgi:hypothetical protein
VSPIKLLSRANKIYFGDAANNISGVNRDVLLAGDVGNALTSRGLSLGIFSNYYRNGFVFDGMVPSGTTDVDRVEILKGPASVLYGRATSSGIVNLIAKEPLPTTHVTLTFQGTDSAPCGLLSTSPAQSEVATITDYGIPAGGDPSAPVSAPFARVWLPPNRSLPSPSAIRSRNFSHLPPKPQSSGNSSATG